MVCRRDDGVLLVTKRIIILRVDRLMDETKNGNCHLRRKGTYLYHCIALSGES